MKGQWSWEKNGCICINISNPHRPSAKTWERWLIQGRKQVLFKFNSVTSCNRQKGGCNKKDISSHKSLENSKQSRPTAHCRRKCYQILVAFISVNETLIFPGKTAWSSIADAGFSTAMKISCSGKASSGEWVTVSLVPLLPCWTAPGQPGKPGSRAHGSSAQLIPKSVTYLFNSGLMETGRNLVSISLLVK